MIKLMTSEEVQERLSTEDALELAIETWERFERAVEEGQKLSQYDFDAGTCALCQSAYQLTHDTDKCDGCAYYEYYGYECYNHGAHYDLAYRGYMGAVENV